MRTRALAFLLLALPLAVPAQELSPWNGSAAPPLDRDRHVGARDWLSDAMRTLMRGLMLRAPSMQTAALTPPRLAPGDHELEVAVGRASRRYIVHIPAGAPPDPALVLVFHGGGGNPKQTQRYVAMDAVADREGFLTVYPYGSGRLRDHLLTWNAGTCCGYAVSEAIDDVAFVRALLDDLAHRMRYDRARVYATGLSNGAMMSYRLAAELGDRIAAIAPVAGAMVLEHFAPQRPVPVMHIHSADDPRAPYDGGLGPPYPLTGARVRHAAVEERLALWAKLNGCSGEREVTERRAWRAADGALHGAERIVYRGCTEPVVLWKLAGAGHVWPGGLLDFYPRLLGPGTRVIDANEEIWRFFRDKRLPQTAAFDADQGMRFAAA